LGVPVIGAAGGNWASSAIHLKNSLQKLGAKPGDKVVLFADAGSPKNPSVLRQYKRAVFELIREGYQLLIGWWHQLDKSHPDIDELDDLTKIEFVSLEDFKWWAEAEQTDTSTSIKPQLNSSKEYVLLPILKLNSESSDVLATKKYFSKTSRNFTQMLATNG
jgi:hypothetical protein